MAIAMNGSVADGRIPILIGVTGHRSLKGSELSRLHGEVSRMLAELSLRYPHTPVLLLSALAEGADSLCAEAASENGMAFGVVLPLRLALYREDFSGETLERFDRLYASAAFVCAPETDAAHLPRSACYQAAGRYILRHSHVLLALWDGVAGEVLPGGTADVVRMARGDASPEENEFGAAAQLPVVHLVSPREGAPAPCGKSDDGFPELEIFQDIDAYNNQLLTALGAAAGAKAELPAESAPAAEAAYRAADSLALRYQKKRMGAILGLSITGLCAVFFFLIFNETGRLSMLVCYGVCLLPAILLYLRSKKSKWHECYTLYRTLAEALRVCGYLQEAGLDGSVRISPWKRDRGLEFVQAALTGFSLHTEAGNSSVSGDVNLSETLRAGSSASIHGHAARLRSVERAWIGGQLSYHVDSQKRKRKKALRNSRWTRVLTIAAALAYFVTLLLVAAFHSVLQAVPPVASSFFAGVSFTDSMLINLVLGLLFAGIAFLANYYGKQALREQIANSEKMERLFYRAQQALVACGEDEAVYEATAKQVFKSLAAAHIDETASWYLFNEGNAPELIFG